MNTPHRHNEIEINYLVQGAMRYWVGDGVVDLPLHTMVVFWATAPHQLIHVEPDTRFYWVTVPLNWFLRWRHTLTDAILNGTWLIDRTTNARPCDEAFLQSWHADYPHPERQEVALLEIEARLARLALSVGTITTLSANTHAETMAKWIAEHYHEPITVHDIAAAVDLHPNYAMRLFRQTFGRSMLDVLTQHRLAHAQRLLVTTQASVLDIALTVGFGSLSRFYAVFKARCGQSPKAYRERMSILPQ